MCVVYSKVSQHEITSEPIKVNTDFRSYSGCLISKEKCLGLVFTNRHSQCLHLVLISVLSNRAYMFSWDALFTSVIGFHLKVLTFDFIHICMLVIDVLCCFPKCIGMHFWLLQKLDLSHLSYSNRDINGVMNMTFFGSVKSRTAILLVEYLVLLGNLTHFGSKMDYVSCRLWIKLW